VDFISKVKGYHPLIA